MPRVPDFERAECLGVDTELFFPTSFADWDASKVAIQAICNRCPIKEPCLDYALTVKVYGIWAGTSEVERKQMRRRLNITAESIC